MSSTAHVGPWGLYAYLFQAEAHLHPSETAIATFHRATAITMEQALAKLGAEGFDRILTAAMANPNAMLHFAGDIPPPTEQVQDYVTEINTRYALFEEFRAACQYNQPNATTLALCMVAPVSEIRSLLQTIHDMPLGVFATCGLLGCTPDGIRACPLLRNFPHRFIRVG